jgi:hypothetical protein
VVKGGIGRVVPVTRTTTQAYSVYRAERDAVSQAKDCDYVFVNLYKNPLGEPMKHHAVNELLDRLSAKAGYKVKPHSLRQTFGSAAVEAATVDVVAELMTRGATSSARHPCRDLGIPRRHGLLHQSLVSGNRFEVTHRGRNRPCGELAQSAIEFCCERVGAIRESEL